MLRNTIKTIIAVIATYFISMVIMLLVVGSVFGVEDGVVKDDSFLSTLLVLIVPFFFARKVYKKCKRSISSTSIQNKDGVEQATSYFSVSDSNPNNRYAPYSKTALDHFHVSESPYEDHLTVSSEPNSVYRDSLKDSTF